MKILIFYILTYLILTSAYAQEGDILIEIDSTSKSDQNGKEVVCSYPTEKYASFPGGTDSLKCLIESRWNKGIINSYQEYGRMIIQFTIDSLGKMQDLQVNPDQIVKTATQLTFVIDKRIVDQIYYSFKDLPDWEPSSMDGKNFKSRWTLMLKFPYEYQCQQN